MSVATDILTLEFPSLLDFSLIDWRSHKRNQFIVLNRLLSSRHGLLVEESAISSKRFLLLDYFVPLAVEKIENLNHLIGGLVAAVDKISLKNGALPLGVAVGS
jgi:hypothetical protein